MIIVLPQKMDNKETGVKKSLELPPAPPPITPSHIIGIRIQLIGKCLPIFSPFLYASVLLEFNNSKHQLERIY
jgi:hypothetical protein